jgi:release factor glutamine methyltransferase
MNPDVEAETIISHILGLKRSRLYIEGARDLTADEESRIAALVGGRRRRYPLQYLLGEVEFMGLRLKMRQGVFIPRPETEILVETVIRRLGRGLRVLDLGTGSGAIAVSLARYLAPEIVVATDVSAVAAALARENAALNGVADRVAVVVADGIAALRRAAPGAATSAASHSGFDLVVGNPPYVATGEIEGLQPEVRDYEPRAALDGGPSGLDFFAGVLGNLPSILRGPGVVAFEIGAAQAAEVSALFAGAGLGGIEVVSDLAGRDRIVLGTVGTKS